MSFRDVTVLSHGPMERAVVFLHPGLGAARSWGRFAPKLCARLNRPGLLYTRDEYIDGPDGTILPHDFIQLEAERVEALLYTHDIKQAIMIGSSDGASIALSHAARFPARVSAVVSIAAHVVIDSTMIKALARIEDETLSDSIPDWLVELHGDCARSFGQAWCGTWRLLMQTNWSMTHLLKDIRCPVLALQGTKDENGSPIQIEEIKNRVSNCTAQFLPRLGHFPFKQDPDMLVTMIAKFLDEQLPQRVSPK